jgi:hypothetical protein
MKEQPPEVLRTTVQRAMRPLFGDVRACAGRFGAEPLSPFSGAMLGKGTPPAPELRSVGGPCAGTRPGSRLFDALRVSHARNG